MYSKPAALLAACLFTGAVTPAKADDISAAQADSLQAAMQGWLQRMLGADTRPAGHLVQVRLEGDHYRIELPLGAPRAGQPSPLTLSASARPAENGRWTFEGPALPSPASFTLDMPAPAGKGQPSIPVEVTVTTGSRDNRGTFDPGFATPSTLTTSSRDVQIRARSALSDQLTTIERTSSASALLPSGAGRVDVTGDATIGGYALTSRVQDAPPMELSAQQVRATGGVTGLSRDQAAAMMPAILGFAHGFLAGAPGPGGNPLAARPPVDPQMLRSVLQSLPGLASEFTLNETFDGVAFRSGTYNGAMNQARIGLGARSEAGLLQASMDLGFDGLVLPDAAPGAMAGLLPRRVALHPVLMGVPTDELIQWLGAAADAKGARPPGFAALLRRGGVSAGLDSFALDVGGTSFAGAGKLTALSPNDLTGQAQITASNFDDLIARVNAVPDLAGALPFLVFAKGISQTAGDHLIWNLSYRDNKLLVNGTDLSAMTGRR